MTQVMIITGGGRGIGAATARLAAERGYAVCLNYLRDHASASEVVADILRSGGKAIAVPGDVAIDADVMRLFETADRELGRVSALVCNAGIIAPPSKLVDMPTERIERMFAVNVTGTLLCAREAVKRMSTKNGGPGGTIVMVSSALVRAGAPGNMLDYAASKGAIEIATRGLATEVADQGIRVNAVRPGVIVTGIQGEGTETRRAEMAKGVAPMKRGGEAMEVARAILWLASAEASYSTGAILDVSGGI
jgi:NAD(P)-dependent dehydrogenase (short-subunit alcohol dehydrogenase family)